MTLRAAKTALVFAVALFYSLIVFSNITDYDSNYQFIRHVLMMDSTFPNNHGMWRAINSPTVHTVFYITTIMWESITMFLCWWGGVRLARAARSNSRRIQSSQAHSNHRANDQPADVASSFPDGRRRVVPDVAIENMERPGSCLPHVHGSRHHPNLPSPTRHRRATLTQYLAAAHNCQ